MAVLRAAGCVVAMKRMKTVGRVVVAGCVAIERSDRPMAVLLGPSGEAEERILTLSGVAVGIASVRWGSTARAVVTARGERADETDRFDDFIE